MPDKALGHIQMDQAGGSSGHAAARTRDMGDGPEGTVIADHKDGQQQDADKTNGFPVEGKPLVCVI